MTRLLLALAMLTSTIVGLSATVSAQGFGGDGYPALQPGRDPGFPAVSAKGSQLDLTPNTCYAESPGTIDLKYDPARKVDKALTHAGYRSKIAGLQTEGSAAVWGIDFASEGTFDLQARFELKSPLRGQTIAFELVKVDSQNRRTESESMTVKIPANASAQCDLTAKLNVPSPGFYELKVRAPSAKSTQPQAIGNLELVTLSGPAIQGARVMTIRSPRTAAAHAQFASSQHPKGIHLGVFEVRIGTPELAGQYFPLTTPFGYFGSLWTAETQRFSGANFSLWSDGDDARNGKIERLSRLLAYRADATYTVFGHEGIGVKPIGENPWASMKPSKVEILAIRLEPGNPFDTYTCYFANLQTGQWELFGSGQKLAAPKAARDLSLGHFMEVIYPSPHLPHESHLRGWLRSADGRWYQVDEMSHGKYSGAESMSHRSYRVTDDGWFAVATGGWYPNDVAKETLQLPARFRTAESKRPVYLKGKYEQDLLSLPFEVQLLGKEKITSRSAELQFNVQPKDFKGSATVYYGPKDHATFPTNIQDRKYPFVKQWVWEQQVDAGSVSGGGNSVKLTGLVAGQEYFYRVLVRNAEYQIWSNESGQFTTKP